MIAHTRRIASWALGIVLMVREETGHTTARNLQITSGNLINTLKGLRQKNVKFTFLYLNKFCYQPNYNYTYCIGSRRVCDVSMLSSANPNCITCAVCWIEEVLREELRPKGLWEMGPLILSMGPEWREVHALALKAATPDKELFAF